MLIYSRPMLLGWFSSIARLCKRAHDPHILGRLVQDQHRIVEVGLVSNVYTVYADLLSANAVRVVQFYRTAM